MKSSYKSLLIKFSAGIIIVIAIGWIVKCQCLSLRALAPAAIRDYIQSFGKSAVLVYIIAYVLNTISVLPPIAPLSLAAGLIFGPFYGALYLMLAAVLGTSATFMISRYFARALVDRMAKGRFRDFDERLKANGFMTVFFLRVIPLLPYEVLNYASGLSKIRFKDYFLATLLGLIPGVAIAAFFGGSLGEIRVFKDILAPKFLAAGGLVIFMVLVPVIYRIIKRRK